VADTPGVDSTGGRVPQRFAEAAKTGAFPPLPRPVRRPVQRPALRFAAAAQGPVQRENRNPGGYGGQRDHPGKSGAFDFRPPTTLNRDEFSSYQDGFLSREYWRAKAEGEKGKSEVTGRRLIPKIYLGPTADRLFGGSYLDFQTNGFVTLDFGAQWQRTQNPNLPVRQQRQFLPLNFDQQMSINFTGKLGEKLKMTGNFDSKASFQFEQNLKLEYTGFEEDIIRRSRRAT
jgi:cell surface protein SprA